MKSNDDRLNLELGMEINMAHYRLLFTSCKQYLDYLEYLEIIRISKQFSSHLMLMQEKKKMALRIWTSLMHIHIANEYYFLN